MGAISEIDALSKRDYADLRKLNDTVENDIDNGDLWIKLAEAAEKPDGDDLTRTSDPLLLQAYRSTMDHLLQKYPLYYGYWIRYATWEFRIAGTEQAEFVYERAVAANPRTVQLWVAYCAFKMDTCHDTAAVRNLFEWAIGQCKYDFTNNELFDKYIEYEDRMELQQNIMGILFRGLCTPSHGNQSQLDRLRAAAPYRPLNELVPAAEAQAYLNTTLTPGDPKETELRHSIDAYYVSMFHSSNAEYNKRRDYEQRIERPYFSTTDLSDDALANWEEYLNFEESEGDYNRTRALYERCLVPCASYELFWMRYYWWMASEDGNESKEGQEEIIRSIFRRASYYYVPMSRPEIRLMWAEWEESIGNFGTADAIYDILTELIPEEPGIVTLRARLHRRHYGLDAGIAIFREYMSSGNKTVRNLGFVVGAWAQMIWKSTGNAERAREIFVKAADHYLDVAAFWVKWVRFELQVPTTNDAELKEQLARLKALFTRIHNEVRIPLDVISDLTEIYRDHLQECGDANAAKEMIFWKREADGPLVCRQALMRKLAADGDIQTTRRRMYLEAGHPGVAINDPLVERGHNPYAQLYIDQGENPYVAGAARDHLRLGQGSSAAASGSSAAGPAHGGHGHGHGHGKGKGKAH